MREFTWVLLVSIWLASIGTIAVAEFIVSELWYVHLYAAYTIIMVFGVLARYAEEEALIL